MSACGDLTAVPLGGGALGEVWAVQLDGAWVAARLLPQGDSDAALGERWARLMRVRHPFLVQAIEVRRMQGRVALVSDLVEGVDLRSRLHREGTVAPALVARWGAEVAGALAALHRAGLAHGDLRAENVLVDAESGSARLVDAGLVAKRGLGDVVDLGALLFEMACGRRPFGAVWGRLDVEDGVRPSVPQQPEGVPAALWEVIEECLAGEPSAARVEKALRAASSGLAGVPAAPRSSVPRKVRVRHGRRRLVAAAIGSGVGALLAGGVVAAAASSSVPAYPEPEPGVLVTPHGSGAVLDESRVQP